MIVNSMYMYLVSAVEKVIELFENGRTKYTFTVQNKTAKLDTEGLHLVKYSRCSFAGVDLRERTSMVIDWRNTEYPGPGTIYVYFRNSSGQQLNSFGLMNDASGTSSFTNAIPQNCRIENATIEFYSTTTALLTRVEIS